MMKRAKFTATLVAVGFIASLAYSAVAQTTQTPPAPPQNQPVAPITRPNQTLPRTNSTDQPVLRGTEQNPSVSPSRNNRNNQMSSLDRQFVMDAAHGGMAEVKLGQLALERSKDEQVRQFAQRMVQEHSQANQQLMRLATQKGITLPTDVGPKYQAAMTRLMQLSGREFDQAYLNEAGVNAHMESTAVYQRQSQLGQDPDLKSFASTVLPRVQDHLQMAAAMTGYRVAGRNTNSSTMPGMSMPGTSMPSGAMDR